MTDSLKLAKMQRTSLEYERQRHLAHWLIRSSPHMTKPPPPNASIKVTQSKLGKSGGTINHNPLFFVAKVNHSGGNLSAISRSQVFTSQTNLPLQMITGQDGHKPKLRRFNSNDTSANMFSVAEFENARLARRNELELKQRQRYKMNSLSSGGDCSTGDSKGSKFSNDSNVDPLPAEIFLERYSMPRVVRLSVNQIPYSDETMQSSSSHGSNSNSSNLSGNNNNRLLNKNTTEIVLLYRHIRDRRIYFGINTKQGIGGRKKCFKIPQEYPGYFSLMNEKGNPTATMYTTLVQLVREQVYKFLSVDNLPAYTESLSTDTFPPQSNYVKTTARGGQIFRLLAVFEDDKKEHSTGTSGREKEKGRYAQLWNENRQIIYVALTAKGKFFEVEQSSTGTGTNQKQNSIDKKKSPMKLNPECVHRINELRFIETELPLNLKHISGPNDVNIPEYITITKLSMENIVISCPIDEFETKSPLVLKKLLIQPELQFIKSFLGFENEQHMFANQNVQNILKFCQHNYEQFLRIIETEHLPKDVNLKQMSIRSKTKPDGIKILRPLNLPNFLRREKSMIAHEREDSIIFFSKNDLENLESQNNQQQRDDGTTGNELQKTNKMKVFQPEKKKWYQNGKTNGKQGTTGSTDNLDLSGPNKRTSLERFQDMSKLLYERFGAEVDILSEENDRSTCESECGVSSSDDYMELRQKSMSLQGIDGEKSFTKDNQPDLVKVQINPDPIGNKLNRNQPLDGGWDDIEYDEEDAIKNQNSFISEKLYSEFHVKTKQHSKSSNGLHNLFPFGMAPKSTMMENKKKLPETRQMMRSSALVEPPVEQTVVDEVTIQESSSFIVDDLPYSSVRDSSNFIIDDDLPYSSVRDSLVIKDEEVNVSSVVQEPEIESIHENVYAEICNGNGVDQRHHKHSSGAVLISINSNGDGFAIKQAAHDYPEDEHSQENIYNTIK